MQLVPAGPPGRSTRKARAYISEIHRLRDAGYTLGDIRDALESAGVRVSVSTVAREALRPLQSSASSGTTGIGAKTAAPQTPSHSQVAFSNDASASASRLTSQSFVNDSRTGKQIVEEFMKGRTTNPLLQERT